MQYQEVNSNLAQASPFSREVKPISKEKQIEELWPKRPEILNSKENSISICSLDLPLKGGGLLSHAVRSKYFHENNKSDRIFFWILKGSALGLGFLLLSIIYFLFLSALPSIQKYRFQFLTSSLWDPVQDIYGALPVIYGTIVSSTIALILATPLSIGAALFLTEFAPPRMSAVIGFLVEMLAAIPSVVYGIWGIFVLTPWLRTTVEPFLKNTMGFLPFFQGAPYGVGMLAAGIILAIMITPTICSISKEIFRSIPSLQKEAALAIGATHWEMIKVSVFQSSKQGILGAIILGLGRALGETMAVTMVIGNRHEISASFFSPASTMASIIANEYTEATSNLHTSALVEVGLTLFIVTLLINCIARILIAKGLTWRTHKR